jgi:hypothetical protein
MLRSVLGDKSSRHLSRLGPRSNWRPTAYAYAWPKLPGALYANDFSWPAVERLAGAGRLPDRGGLRSDRDHLAIADERGQAGDIAATGEGLVITLRRAKGDQEGAGANIGLS